MFIKAALFEDIKKIVYREDYPKPIVGLNDVIVKVDYCGICGSDITNFKYKMYQVPIIMGHEFAGEVIEVGEDVSGVNLGDKVCGINVSLDVGHGELGGLGIFQNGGFAEYVKVPNKYLFHIPISISTKEAIMIESFANAARGTRLSKIGSEQNIFIIGGGNIGLCFLKFLLVEKNPKYIGVIEPNDFLREKATEFGATETFPPNMIKIKKFIKKFGEPSFIFDCAGNEKSLMMGIELIKKGGTILLEGVYKGSISFPMFLINSKEVCLKGCLGHDQQDILNSIEFFSQNKVDANEYISQILPLKNIQEAFERYLKPGDREFIKIAIKIN